MKATTLTANVDVINWAIEQIKRYEQDRKAYNAVAIFLSILDVLCGVIAVFYSGMLISAVVASVLTGAVWSGRTIQFIKIQKLTQALKVLTPFSIAYIAARMKRREFMKDIKIRNWIVGVLNIAAIGLGVALLFVEPSLLTDNIAAVITGVGSLLGINIAIPVFNDAHISAEEKAAKENARLEKEAALEAAKALEAETAKALETKKAEILAQKLNKTV